MTRVLKHITLLVLFTFTVSFSLQAQTKTTKDSLAVKKDTLNLKYDFKYTQKGGLFLDDLAKKEVDEDAYKLRDTLYKLIRLEMQRVIRETKE